MNKLLLMTGTIFAVTGSLTLMSTAAYADDTVKALLGGIVGSLIVEGVKQANQPPEQDQQQQQNEQINWQDERQQSRTVGFSEDTRSLQSDLKALGYYNGAIDGIGGSGTQQAILKWEAENCLPDDGSCRNGSLDRIERNVIQSHAENQRNNQQIREREKQEVQDRSVQAENNILAQNLLKDGEEFLKSYKGETNVALIASDLKTLQNPNYNPAFKDALNRVQTFFNGLDGFEQFHNAKNMEREAENLEKKRSRIAEIRKFQEFSDEHLKNNITSINALNLSQKLQKIDLVNIDQKSLDEVNEIHENLRQTINSESLQNAYQTWWEKKNPAIPTTQETAINSEHVQTASHAELSDNLPEQNTRFQILVDILKRNVVVQFFMYIFGWGESSEGETLQEYSAEEQNVETEAEPEYDTSIIDDEIRKYEIVAKTYQFDDMCGRATLIYNFFLEYQDSAQYTKWKNTADWACANAYPSLQ